MRHVDEGQLHAFLDHELEGGEDSAREVERHLAQCEVCRAELEGVRLLRERGRALLEGNVAFPVSQPSFAEVVARAGRSQAQPRTSWGPRRLAWAASIAVALGTGWLARDLLTPDASMRTAIVSEDAVATSEAPTAPAASVESVQLSRQADAAPSSKVQAAPIETTAREEVGAASDVSNAEELAAAPAPVPAPPPPAVVMPSDQTAVPLEGLVAVGYATARNGAAAAVAPPAAPASQGVSARSEAAGPTQAAFSAPTNAVQWAAIDRARASAILGAGPLTIANMPVVAIETATISGTQVVRVRQDLGAGREITLTQERAPNAGGAATRAGAAAEALPAPVRVQRAGVVVTVTGPLPPEDLRALLDRLP